MTQFRRLKACARQRPIQAHAALETRQEIGAADIGEQADSGFRHREGRRLAHDAVRAVERNAYPAAHHEPVDERDEGLGKFLDRGVEPVLFGPERAGIRRAVAPAFEESAHIAAGREGAIAGPADDDGADPVVDRPRLQLRRDRAHHVERQRVQRPGPVERDDGGVAAPFEQDFRVVHGAATFSRRRVSCLRTRRSEL